MATRSPAVCEIQQNKLTQFDKAICKAVPTFHHRYHKPCTQCPLKSLDRGRHVARKGPGGATAHKLSSCPNKFLLTLFATNVPQNVTSGSTNKKNKKFSVLSAHSNNVFCTLFSKRWCCPTAMISRVRLPVTPPPLKWLPLIGIVYVSSQTDRQTDIITYHKDYLLNWFHLVHIVQSGSALLQFCTKLQLTTMSSAHSLRGRPTSLFTPLCS